jgi:acyl-CoA hydrolase
MKGSFFAPGGPLPLAVAFVQVSPPDAHGYCSLGPSVDVTCSAVEHARLVVALRPSDYINDTRVIRQFEQIVAINSAIQHACS